MGMKLLGFQLSVFVSSFNHLKTLLMVLAACETELLGYSDHFNG